MGTGDETGLALGTGQVALWLGYLGETSEARLLHYSRLLSPPEMAANQRFSRESLRHRDILCRGMLRELLAVYLGAPPADVPLSRTGAGKPYISRTGADSRSGSDGGAVNYSYNYRFNYSHSGDYVAYAISNGIDVGVDIEHTARRSNALAIARSFFSPQEYAALRRVSRGELQSTFYRYWTLKEAYLKARGEGISAGLAGFALNLAAATDAGIGISFLDGRDDSPGNWQFLSLAPLADYRLALAARCGSTLCVIDPLRYVGGLDERGVLGHG